MDSKYDDRYLAFLLNDPALTSGDLDGFCQRFRDTFNEDVEVLKGPGYTDERIWDFVVRLPQGSFEKLTNHWTAWWWREESHRVGPVHQWPPPGWGDV